MCRCCGLTKKGKRCAKGASYTLLISGVDYDVCHIHSTQPLLSEWETEISERLETNVTGVGDVPTTIMDWLHAFNECYNETASSEVSAMYATIMRHTREFILSFEDKFDIYVGTLVDESHSRSGGECCVCYDTTEIVKTECDHTLCMNCMKEWTRRSTSCPMCRTRF